MINFNVANRGLSFGYNWCLHVDTDHSYKSKKENDGVAFEKLSTETTELRPEDQRKKIEAVVRMLKRIPQVNNENETKIKDIYHPYYNPKSNEGEITLANGIRLEIAGNKEGLYNFKIRVPKDEDTYSPTLTHHDGVKLSNGTNFNECDPSDEKTKNCGYEHLPGILNTIKELNKKCGPWFSF